MSAEDLQKEYDARVVGGVPDPGGHGLRDLAPDTGRWVRLDDVDAVTVGHRSDRDVVLRQRNGLGVAGTQLRRRCGPG
jgi:hypothetical protein